MYVCMYVDLGGVKFKRVHPINFLLHAVAIILTSM